MEQGSKVRQFPRRQPVAVADIVTAFKRGDSEEGTYHVQHGGQSYIATARKGFSLESLTPIGTRVPTSNVQATEPWVVTCISEQVLPINEESYQQQR